MGNPIEDAVKGLNEQRLALLKEGRKKAALEVQRAMLRTDRDTAHRLIQAGRKNAGNTSEDAADGSKVGRYRSRSGSDIRDVVAEIPTFVPKKKTKTVVTSPHRSVLTHITEKAYAELSAMSDDQLDELFGNVATEKQWLEQEGKPINRKAGAAPTRKKTRKVLEAAVAEEVQKPIELKDMKRAELDAYATEQGIDPSAFSKKEDLIAALIAVDEPPKEPKEPKGGEGTEDDLLD